MLSRIQLFATPWIVAYQAPLSMQFPRQEYRSGLSFPSPGDLPNPGSEPRSPTLQADSLPSEPSTLTVLLDFQHQNFQDFLPQAHEATRANGLAPGIV